MRTIRWGVLAVLLCHAGNAWAQWGVSAEIGTLRFAGGAADTNDLSVHPYRSTSFGLGVDREIGSVRVGLEGRYAKTGLGGEGRGVAVVYYDLLSMIEVAPLVSVRIARFGQGLSLRIEGGPIGNIWKFQDEDDRLLIGGRAAASVEWPLMRRMTGSLRVAEALSPTIFEDGDFDEDSTVELRSTWRTSVSLALRYRL